MRNSCVVNPVIVVVNQESLSPLLPPQTHKPNLAIFFETSFCSALVPNSPLLLPPMNQPHNVQNSFSKVCLDMPVQGILMKKKPGRDSN